jgi:hypothetical protein
MKVNYKIKRRKNQLCCKLPQDFKSFIKNPFGCLCGVKSSLCSAVARTNARVTM